MKNRFCFLCLFVWDFSLNVRHLIESECVDVYLSVNLLILTLLNRPQKKYLICSRWWHASFLILPMYTLFSFQCTFRMFFFWSLSCVRHSLSGTVFCSEDSVFFGYVNIGNSFKNDLLCCVHTMIWTKMEYFSIFSLLTLVPFSFAIFSLSLWSSSLHLLDRQE